jgi:hypothetical protein
MSGKHSTILFFFGLLDHKIAFKIFFCQNLFSDIKLKQLIPKTHNIDGFCIIFQAIRANNIMLQFNGPKI